MYTIGTENASSSTYSSAILTSLLIVITLAWIMRSLWERTVETLWFNHLGYDKESWFDSLMIATIVTIMTIIIINFLDLYRTGTKSVSKIVVGL